MKPVYRPEIDGLRAIAVTSVIIYHAQLTSMPLSGGYIGVDIFFVISGYLITKIILEQLQNNKKFFFSSFYERRVRRIIPALFFLLSVVSIISLFFIYFLPSSLVNLSESSIFATFFFSNIFFYQDGLIYGGENGFYKPLLHTWSLSVEEQFYIIFPVILFYLHKYFYKNLENIFIFLIVLGLLYATYSSINSPSLNFYNLFSRFWELLVGGYLAIAEIKKRLNKKNYFVYLPVIGLLLIFISFITFNKDTLHPSVFTLIPVVGVALIIKYVKFNHIILKILSLKPAIFIGLISYSLYLWHYVVFAFYRITASNDSSLMERALIIFIILSISIFSYFFIEIKFRNKKIINFKNLIKSILIFLIIILGINFYVIKNKGFQNRMIVENINLDNFSLQKERNEKLNSLKKNNYIKSKKEKILIIGNSFGGDLYMIFEMNEDLKKQYQFLYYETQISCLDEKSFSKNKCKTFDLNELQNLQNKSDLIMFASKWYLDDLKLIEKIVSNNQYLNKKLVIVGNPPEFNNYGNFTFIDRFIFDNQRKPDKHEKSKLEKKYYESFINNLDILDTNKFLNNFAKKNNLPYLNREDLVCQKKQNTCIFFTNDNQKMYYDPGHLTLEGIVFLGKEIYKKKLLFNLINYPKF